MFIKWGACLLLGFRKDAPLKGIPGGAVKEEVLFYPLTKEIGLFIVSLSFNKSSVTGRRVVGMLLKFYQQKNTTY